MNPENSVKEAKADAPLYLLTILIQKVSKEQPDLVDEMIEGINADQAGLPLDTSNKEHINKVFEESARVLKQIKGFGSIDS